MNESKTLTIRIPENVYTELQTLSKQSGLSINKIVSDVLKVKMSDEKSKQKMIDGYAVFFNRG